MKKIVLILALLCSPALAQNFGYNGQCAKGGQLVVTQGLASSGTQPIGGVPFVGGAVIGSFPSCTVTVFATGTSTPSTIFSSAAGAALGNPFTANTDGSFLFFAAAGGYDVVLSGGGLPTTVTLTDINLGGGGGGGGSSFYQTIQVGGVVVTPQQGILNFIGSNLSIGCMNNSINGSTDCTFTGLPTGVVSYTGGTGGARTGAVSYLNTDPGVAGALQVGTGTWPFKKQPNGTMIIGDAAILTGNALEFYPDSAGGLAFVLSDTHGDFIAGNTSGLGWPGIEIDVGNGTGSYTNWNTTDIVFGSAGASIWVDYSSTVAKFNIPANLLAGFTLPGSVSGNCAVFNGTVYAAAACSSGTVSAVNGTANQITSTGTSTITLSLPSLLIPPGTVQINQPSSGNNALTITMANSASAGTGILLRNNALSTIGFWDYLGNLQATTVATNGTGSGYLGLTAGVDNIATCITNGGSICIQAPTTVSAAYGINLATLGPSATMIPVYSALSANETTETYTALSGTFPVNATIASALSSLTGAGPNTLVTMDGSGNLKPTTTGLAAVTQTCNSAAVTQVVICGKVDSLGLTGSLGNTNILTASAAQPGQYLLSVYMNETANPCIVVGGGQFVPKITYSDSNGAVTRSAVTFAFTTGATAQQPITIPIQIVSSATTLNVLGTYTACGTPNGSGAYTLDAHYTLVRVE